MHEPGTLSPRVKKFASAHDVPQITNIVAIAAVYTSEIVTGTDDGLRECAS